MSEQSSTVPDHRSLKEYLFEWMDLPSDEQLRRLNALSQTDAAMAQELRSLLGHAQHTSPGLRAPERLFQSMSQAQLPDRFGPWQVEGELGRGGMGVVLRGRRADGAFDKVVAIKVLPPLLSTDAAAKRFVHEAQLLAPLDHPHIARLIDAGVAQGCAYFVMDWVDGQPITAHAKALPLRQRLELFLQLCSALAFAHSRLLIHRDIKPGNVLVDSRGQVRLLDFGIAKLVDQADTTQTAMQAALTPAYASPEQIKGEAVTTQSDVFALGVLLYELCAHAHPFMAQSGDTPHNTAATLHAMLNREVDRAAMQRVQLPADLQAILRKALEKSPDQRYGSVDALASDVQAFLAGQQVKAQPPSWRYAARKFVQRNRGLVSSALLVSGTIVGLSAWALYNSHAARQQALLAEKRLAVVREIANKVVFDYNRALAPINGTLEVRKTLAADALQYLQRQLDDARGDLGLISEVARGLEAVGSVQGKGMGSSNLGDLEGARATLAKAQTLRAEVCAQAPGQRVVAVDAQVRIPACAAQAAVLMSQADNLFALRRIPDAMRVSQEAKRINDAVLSQLVPADSAYVPVAKVQVDLNHRLAGLSLRQSGKAYDEGMAFARTNLPVVRELVRQVPGDTMRMQLREALDLLAYRLVLEGRVDEARPHAEEALQLARDVFKAKPGGEQALVLNSALFRLAEVSQHQLKFSEAEPLMNEALQRSRGLHEADPKNSLLRMRYANVAARVGKMLNAMDSPASHAKAEQVLAQVWPVSSAFTPSDGVLWLQHQQISIQRAKAALALGHPHLAHEWLQALPHLKPGADMQTVKERAEAYGVQAQAAQALGRNAEVKDLLERALAPRRQRAQDTLTDVNNRGELALLCQWAAQAPALSTEQAAYAECASSQMQSLQTAQVLSPWWKKKLGLRA